MEEHKNVTDIKTHKAPKHKQEEALKEFKEAIADLRKPQHDDYELLKWLKARQYDVVKAEEMYRTSMAYRQKLGVDKLLEEYEPPEVLKMYLAGGFSGYDKEGSPVKVELFGRLDIKGIVYSAKKVDLEKTKLLQCEKTVMDWKQQSEKSGDRVDGLTVIFDMEGVTSRVLWRPGLQMYLHLVKVLEDNYPEMMKRMFVVNAPRIFPLLYKLCRPLISEDTRNKIHVLGSNFKDTLLKYIDAEELPMFLGGLKTDPDGNPRCVTMICQGGEVPKEYYLLDNKDDDHMKTASISRGGKLCLSYQVDVAGSVLRWEFKTEDFDIDFGVFMVQGENSVPVVPLQRVNSHIVPEDGTLICEETGTYILTFCNKHSYLRKKILYYFAEIISEDLSASPKLSHKKPLE
ncbi:retinal-binding protein-like isoform X2 [Pomacea canaliculata]|uniref:retinal-binding protein-like isoform X2 n=1 Tax=Pomacea canaliculata TaxID=400727 RepID=UPI000D7263AE|nr:retinal-binding protein-like isoform X2 [Pomacea canaliculata]